MQTETRSQSPGGSYDNSPTFEFQGWVRSREDPTSGEAGRNVTASQGTIREEGSESRSKSMV